MRREVVHVMLKPDTLERGLRDVIVAELEGIAGPVFASKKLILGRHQIEEIYSRFPNPYSKAFVFNYFTSQYTEHLAFLGEGDLHDRIHKAKGRTGSGVGIRGRYFSDYVHYTQLDIEKWLEGTSDRAEEIDVEMFGRDILHVADNQVDSMRGLEAVMGSVFDEILQTMSSGAPE